MEKENEVLIKAGKTALHYWSEVWNQRELFWILGKRDVMVRYKQSVLGIFWAVIRTLLTTMVMVFAFGKIAKLDQGSSIPYSLIVIPGVIVWLFFSQSLVQISNSIVGNANLVSKVYFPRIIIPFSSLLVGLLDAVIAIIIFIIFCIYYQFTPGWYSIFAPFFLILAYLGSFGFGLFAATLNVKYRDIGQIIPFIVQFGYFISPVAYSVEKNKNEWWYPIYNLNPVAGAIDGMRWSLLNGNASFNWQSFIPMLISVTISVLVSIWYFRKNENSFVDHI